MRGFLKGTLLAAALSSGLYGSGAVALDAYGHRAPDGDYDAIIVAGCRVKPDGSPSLALQRRTRKAVELWRQGLAPRVVFTGGVGESSVSEARAASDYAESIGLPEGAVLLEERSTSTEENAKFSTSVIDPASRVVVVTDTYHVFRAERVFGRVFAEATGAGSVAAPDVRVKGALREVLAVSGYAIAGRL